MLGALVHSAGLAGAPCAGKPAVWLPGAVEPLARTLPTAAARAVKVPKLLPQQPDWTELDPWGGTYTDPSSTAIELPADQGALDALGRMVSAVPGVAAPLSPAVGWRDTDQYGKDLRWIGAAIFQAMRRWGADLPEDVQTDDDSGQDWSGWPHGTNHTTRYIYAWNVDKDFNVTQVMQVQKWLDPFEAKKGEASGWLVYNKWGTDLTFSRTTPSGTFASGFDLGAWLTQNQCALGGALFTAFQVGYTALASAVSMGAYGAEAAASLQTAQAIQKLTQGTAQAIDKGDFAGALVSLAQLGAAIGSIPFDGATFGGRIGDAIAEIGRPLVDNDVTRALAKLVTSSGGSGGLGELLGSVTKVAGELKGIVDLGVQKFEQFRQQFDNPTTRHFLDLGWKAAQGNNIFGTRAQVPWYGLPDYDVGAAAGAVAVAQQGGAITLPVKATRISRGGPADIAFAPALVPRQPMPAPAGLPSSSTTKLLVGGAVVGGAALAAVYTAPGRAALGAATRAGRALLRQPTKLLVLEALAVASAGAALYALTRPSSPAPAAASPAASPEAVTALAPALR